MSKVGYRFSLPLSSLPLFTDPRKSRHPSSCRMRTLRVPLPIQNFTVLSYHVAVFMHHISNPELNSYQSNDRIKKKKKNSILQLIPRHKLKAARYSRFTKAKKTATDRSFGKYFHPFFNILNNLRNLFQAHFFSVKILYIIFTITYYDFNDNLFRFNNCIQILYFIIIISFFYCLRLMIIIKISAIDRLFGKFVWSFLSGCI